MQYKKDIIMKNITLLMFAAIMALSFQACSKNEPLNENYSLKGGLSVTLPEKDFGVLREVEINPEEIMKIYKKQNPSATGLKTFMYDNFESYPPVVFSYAYTKADAEDSANQEPFGFEGVIYDNIEEISISGKKCRKSSFVDLETEKKITTLSCKDENQSWDIVIQSFYANPQVQEGISQEQKNAIYDAAETMNRNLAAITDEAIKSIEIK